MQVRRLIAGVFAGLGVAGVALAYLSWFTGITDSGPLLRDATFEVSPIDTRIVFTALGNGGLDIFVLNLDDHSVERLAETDDYEVTPAFSPDGNEVVYAAGPEPDAANHLFLRPVTGGNSIQLTTAVGSHHEPKFSRDGTWITFARDEVDEWALLGPHWSGSAIFVVRRDGTNERRITPVGQFGYSPRFSRDGRSVTYYGDGGWLAVPLEGDATPVAVHPGLELRADVSPDEQFQTYCEGEFAPDVKVYLARIDGSETSLLTPALGSCSNARFSRAMDRIYFTRDEWPDGHFGHSTCSLWEVTLGPVENAMIADDSLFLSPLTWKPTADSE
jgi:Tol biopolymer transport system component